MDLLAKQLGAGIDALAIELDKTTQNQLLEFIVQLNKWNKVYNLTSIRNLSDMVTLHLLDSLSVLPAFNPHDDSLRRILDVGTGGGIPGIPLAICLPRCDFVLMDAREKKIHFIQTVISSLGLTNIKAVHARVENYQDEEKFDRIISRAFASLTDMLKCCGHLCRPGGKFLAMKGQFPEEEIAQLPKGFKIEKINQLKVPGLDADRHLLAIGFD